MKPKPGLPGDPRMEYILTSNTVHHQKLGVLSTLRTETGRSTSEKQILTGMTTLLCLQLMVLVKSVIAAE